MKMHWFNQNRCWIKNTVQMTNDKQPVKDMKVNPESDVLMILKYDSTIEIKGLLSNTSICIDLGATPVNFVLWGSKRLELSVFTLYGQVFVIQLSEDIVSWKIVHVWKSHYQNRSYYIGDEVTSSILSLYKVDGMDTIQRLEATLPDEIISSVCTLHNVKIIGAKSGRLYCVLGSDVQRLDSDHDDEITTLKKIDEYRFLSASRDCRVYLWNRYNYQEWKCTLLGQHTGWIYDCVVDSVNEVAYTSGADGIVGVWDLDQACMLDSIPVNEGVASCLALVGEEIYVGHHLGKVISLKKQKKGKNVYHRNSIWNMISDQKKGILYSGGADGRILCTRISDGQLLKSLNLSNGWINGFDYSNQVGMVSVSSEGEILFLDREETVKLEKYWFNNIKVHDDTNKLFVVSAEGDIVILDTHSKEVTGCLSHHQDQVMDLVLDLNRKLLISTSIDGTVIFWDLIHHKLIDSLTEPHFHPTSMTLCNDQLLVSSLEGDVIFIDLDKYQIINRRNLHKGRLWKISGSSEQSIVATVGTDRFLRIWDMNDCKELDSWKSDSLLTTCLLTADKVYAGDQNGEIVAFQLIETRKRLKGKNVIFVDGRKNTEASTQRVIGILEDMNIDYTLCNVCNDEASKRWIVNQSGWNQFPQVFFNGKYIGSGSVLYEMHRTKTLERIIQKCYVEWNSEEKCNTARRQPSD